MQDKITSTKSSTPKSSITTNETEEQAYSPPILYVSRMEPQMAVLSEANLIKSFTFRNEPGKIPKRIEAVNNNLGGLSNSLSDEV